jgi:DNA-binding XRE family transcriptional regulator
MSLKAHRVNSNYTQLEVCEKLGISKNTLISYEKFRSVPDISLGLKFAELYGCTVDDIKWSKE